MEIRNDPPLIFDPHLRALRRARAERRGPSFLIQRCVADAADRLNDVNRHFDSALIMGRPEFCERFLDAVSPGKLRGTPTLITTLEPQHLTPEISPQTPYDLIISGLDLHTVDDVPGRLMQIKTALKPDGLFIGALFGGDSLADLRAALYHADSHILGGVSARVYPFMTHMQAASLMQRAGFALPVIDIDRVKVSYSRIQRLISDLRDLGDTNILHARDPKPLGKAYYAYLENSMKTDDETGKIMTQFEIYWLTGWSPHDSQQKPLKPGSAKMRLSEALKSQAR